MLVNLFVMIVGFFLFIYFVDKLLCRYIMLFLFIVIGLLGVYLMIMLGYWGIFFVWVLFGVICDMMNWLVLFKLVS